MALDLSQRAVVRVYLCGKIRKEKFIILGTVKTNKRYIKRKADQPF